MYSMRNTNTNNTMYGDVQDKMIKETVFCPWKYDNILVTIKYKAFGMYYDA